MIINPYNFSENNVDTKSDKQEKQSPEIIREISEFVLTTFQELVENNKQEKIREKVKQQIECVHKITNLKQQSEIIQEVINKIFGYGILQKYIEDSNISDIRAVSYNLIYVKKNGIWERVAETFESEEEFNNYIRFCAMKNNAVVNTESPICIFSDRNNNLRLEAGIPPTNVEHPNLVIRIHQRNNDLGLEDLMAKANMLNEDMYKYILNEIKNHKSFVICGKGGSGKTTLLKAILNELPKEMAITISEETVELYLKDRNVISRECMLGRKEEGKIDLERLTRHSLVMSNDVLVLGELKGAEANTFFDALSTGHMGLTTVHAESSAAVIDRLITLIKKDVRAQYYTEDFLKKNLSESIDNIIFMENFKIVNISKIVRDKKFKLETVLDSGGNL